MWKPMSELPEIYGRTNKMFVVKAFRVHVGGAIYTSDPYCVWITLGGKMPRWPHEFEPTHFCELPENLK
ncbi:hypothetical protein D3C80_388050 [compost metagenome]